MFDRAERHAKGWFHWLECSALAALAVFLAIRAQSLLATVVLSVIAVIAVISLFALLVVTVQFVLPLFFALYGTRASKGRALFFCGLSGVLAGVVVSTLVFALVAHSK
jgi:hypothetical protein